MVPHLPSGEGADAERGRLVGPGGLLRPAEIYEVLEKHDTRGMNFLVVGPWNHGGWARGRATRSAPIPFGSDTAAVLPREVQAPLFAYFLKDKGTRDLPEALTFEAGTNRWRRWDAWPPKERRLEDCAGSLYFDAGRRRSRSEAADGADAGRLRRVTSPTRRIRCRTGSGRSSRRTSRAVEWSTWLVEDQRFVDDRADVLSWESAAARRRT